MRIRYVAPALCPDGYGEFSRYIIWALHHLGHELTVSTFLHNAQEPAARFGRKGILAESLIERTLSGTPEINIVNSTPTSFEQFRIPGAFNVGFTMYESEKIPETAVQACNRMDALFVPSAWNKAAFKAFKVKPPVFVVHPPMDPALAPPVEHERPDEGCVFYSVFEWRTPHKDPLSLLTAYFREFQDGERVLLRIKTFERTRPGAIEQDIRDLKKRLGLAKYPRVELVLGSLSNDEMWAYYGQADAYVSSHHGEGWGMPIWEAMTCGLPTIATGYGANMEFMTMKNSYPVAWTNDKARQWANVDVSDLRAKMRSVFENPAEASVVGRRARYDILKTCTPAATEAMVMKPLERRAS